MRLISTMIEFKILPDPKQISGTLNMIPVDLASDLIVRIISRSGDDIRAVQNSVFPIFNTSDLEWSSALSWIRGFDQIPFRILDYSNWFDTLVIRIRDAPKSRNASFLQPFLPSLRHRLPGMGMASSGGMAETLKLADVASLEPLTKDIFDRFLADVKIY